MSLPSLAVINFTSTLHDDEVRAAIHAVNRQITENFSPLWGYGRNLEAFVPSFAPADDATLAEEIVPADSVMYLVDESSVAGALGFHDLNTRDVPFGFVFVLNPKDWTTTLSHETLELILDPTANVSVAGPDPRNASNTVLHDYEACDAVERLSYKIGEIQVSDFVTPSYFTVGEATGRKNDFLGVGLRSFGVTRGSHISFFDVATGSRATVNGEETPARKHLAAMAKAHDHVKAERPSEEKLRKILSAYQGGKHHSGCCGLPQLRGITRTARYNETATRLSGAVKAARK